MPVAPNAGRIQVNVTDKHGMPCPDLPINAIALARAGQIDELEETQLTDDSGTAYFTIDEPCFFRPMLSQMFKRELRIQILGMGGGNIVKHAVVDLNGFGTHTTIQAALDYIATLTEGEEYIIHVNPGEYREQLSIVLAGGTQITLEAQGGFMARWDSIDGGAYNAAARIRDRVDPPPSAPILKITGFGQVLLRGLQITSDVTQHTIQHTSGTKPALTIDNCLIEQTQSTGNWQALDIGDTGHRLVVRNSVIYADGDTIGFGTMATATPAGGLEYSRTFENVLLESKTGIIGDLIGGFSSFSHCVFISQGNYCFKIDNHSIYEARFVANQCWFFLEGNATNGLEVVDQCIFVVTGSYVQGKGSAQTNEAFRCDEAYDSLLVGNRINGCKYGVHFETTQSKGIAVIANVFEGCDTAILNDSGMLDATSVIGPNVFRNSNTADMTGVDDANNYRVSKADAGTSTITDPGDAGAIPVTQSGQVALVTAGAETRTLAIPTFVGQEIHLFLKTDGGNCVVTVAGPVNVAGNNTLTFDNESEQILLKAIDANGTLEWSTIANDGVGLTTV